MDSKSAIFGVSNSFCLVLFFHKRTSGINKQSSFDKTIKTKVSEK
jgi:hypothetical protein